MTKKADFSGQFENLGQRGTKNSEIKELNILNIENWTKFIINIYLISFKFTMNRLRI